MIQNLNDSYREVKSARTAWRWLAGVNGGGALVSAGYAVAGMIDPTAIGDGAVTSLVRSYAEAYAVRAIPLAAVLLLLLVRRARTALVPILVVAGLAQFGDAVIGVQVGQHGMILGGTLLAAIHLLSAVRLHRQPVA